MRKAFSFVLFVTLVAVSSMTTTAGQQARPVSTTTDASVMSPDEVLKAIRTDLQTSRTDIISKNVTLTVEQAAKFWPIFNQYQQEQNVIMDDQLKGLQRYVDHYEELDDAAALVLMNAHFDRDARMNELRQKYLGELQKVLPTRLAVRVMQIDRRISLLHQLEHATRIPLVN